MFVHHLPSTRAISFTDYLYTSHLGTELSQTTEKRSKLQQTIKSVTEQRSIGDDGREGGGLQSQKEWIKVVQGVEDYLPFLYSVYNSVKTDDLLLKGELLFTWKDTLLDSSLSKVTLPGIQYELLSVLVLQAKALCNFAASLVDSLGKYEQTDATTLSDEERKRKEDRLKFAADLQCRAAAIFAYVGREVIPEWERLEGSSRLIEMGRSVETAGEVAFALSKLAHAEAELLVIRKLLSPCACYQTAHHTSSPPLASNHPSPSLLSKLYLNVASLYDSALSLSQTASSKAGIRVETLPSSSASDSGKKGGPSSRSFGAAIKQKMSNRSSAFQEESVASGKVSTGFSKYLFKSARASRSRAYFWLGVDKGERGQYGEALGFFKLASDELETTMSGRRINLHKDDKAKEEKREFARDKEESLRLIGHFAASYQQLNNSVAFQPIPSSSSLTSQIPAGRSATGLKPYVSPVPAFGPGSVDYVTSSLQSIKAHGGSDDDKSSTSNVQGSGPDYAGKGAYY